ncbi:MAG: FMN-binding negative transcriptional regulator [Actinomycetota bacterium]|nr:FMN-binding negative transcriptional regulator [Actinomycetota bacterium]
MYRPAHFDIADADELHSLLQAAEALHLITSTSDGMDASMLPMLFDPAPGEHGSLVGHLARANPQWRAGDGTPALAIVPGADAYVSPSWYATKAETGKVVPTWNYTVVHVHGHLRVHDDPEWLGALVRALTDRHEAALPRPWSVDDAPPDYIAASLRGIVGVELRIDRIEGKRKLSQNRTAADVEGAIAGLSGREPASQRVADDMRAASDHSD